MSMWFHMIHILFFSPAPFLCLTHANVCLLSGRSHVYIRFPRMLGIVGANEGSPSRVNRYCPHVRPEEVLATIEPEVGAQTDGKSVAKAWQKHGKRTTKSICEDSHSKIFTIWRFCISILKIDGLSVFVGWFLDYFCCEGGKQQNQWCIQRLGFYWFAFISWLYDTHHK